MRTLNALAEAGNQKITNRRSLYASDYIELIDEASLGGSDQLFELITKVYAIGFEKGYRASQYDSKKRYNKTSKQNERMKH